MEQVLLDKNELLRPGFVRVSLGFYWSKETLQYVIDAVNFVATHGWRFLPAYTFFSESGDWKHRSVSNKAPFRRWLHSISYSADGKMQYQTRADWLAAFPAGETDVRRILSAAHEHAQQLTRQYSHPSARGVDQSLLLPETVRAHGLQWFVLPSEVIRDLVAGTEPKVYEGYVSKRRFSLLENFTAPAIADRKDSGNTNDNEDGNNDDGSDDGDGDDDDGDDDDNTAAGVDSTKVVLLPRDTSKGGKKAKRAAKGSAGNDGRRGSKGKNVEAVIGEEEEQEQESSQDLSASGAAATTTVSKKVNEKQGSSSSSKKGSKGEASTDAAMRSERKPENSKKQLKKKNDSSNNNNNTTATTTAATAATAATSKSNGSNVCPIQKIMLPVKKSKQVSNLPTKGDEEDELCFACEIATQPQQQQQQQQRQQQQQGQAANDSDNDDDGAVLFDMDSLALNNDSDSEDKNSNNNSNNNNNKNNSTESAAAPTETSSSSSSSSLQNGATNFATMPRSKLFPEIPKSISRTVGKAIMDYGMIKEGDRLLLGLSGGKDSLTLLHVLLGVQRRAPIRFELAAVTMDPQFPGFDPSPLIPYMKALGVPYFYESQALLSLAENARPDSICAWCSRMKREFFLWMCVCV